MSKRFELTLHQRRHMGENMKMKKWSIALAIRGMQFTTAMRHLTISKIKELVIPS